MNELTHSVHMSTHFRCRQLCVFKTHKEFECICIEIFSDFIAGRSLFSQKRSLNQANGCPPVDDSRITMCQRQRHV